MAGAGAKESLNAKCIVEVESFPRFDSSCHSRLKLCPVFVVPPKFLGNLEDVVECHTK